MEPLGLAPASGRGAHRATPDRPGRVPSGAVGGAWTPPGWMPPRPAAEGDRRHRGDCPDGTVRAELPAGGKRVAVVAAPRIAGWRCAAGGSPERPAGDFHGLIAVPLDATATSLTCTFHPTRPTAGREPSGPPRCSPLLLLAAVTAVRRRRRPGAARPLHRASACDHHSLTAPRGTPHADIDRRALLQRGGRPRPLPPGGPEGRRGTAAPRPRHGVRVRGRRQPGPHARRP